MKQALRIAIPLVALVAVVFGVTYFSRYTRKVDETQVTTAPEPGLRFGSSSRFWNPVGSLEDQHFPGFYERRTDAAGGKNRAGFWFENRNPNSITLTLKGVSCTTCSGGRVAAIPTEVTRQFLQMSAIQVLPQGLVSALPVGFCGPAANLASDRGALRWQSYDFLNNPQASYSVPPATNNDGWSPQWGILELLFSVDAGPKTITANFNVFKDGTEQHEEFSFTVGFVGVEEFDLSRTDIPVGDLNETTSPEQKYEILVFSATRGPGSELGDLAVPVSRVDMPPGYLSEPGPFVSIGDPIRIPDRDLLELTLVISNQLKKPMRVRSAYRVPVTIRTHVGERKIDLGPLERIIAITVPQTSLTRTVTVKGTVHGGVWLEDSRREILLNDSYKRGASQTYRLVTEKPDAELTLIDAECKPAFMKVALKRLPADGDRGSHELRVEVPRESKAGPWYGMIVLEVKGKNPQKIRIPVFGKGNQ